MNRGEIWWANLRTPKGSDPGYRRPVVIVQSDAFNQSRIRTVIVAVVTSNLNLALAPGNVPLTRRDSRLNKRSVINVSQLITIDRSFLTERIGKIPKKQMTALDEGLKRVLSL